LRKPREEIANGKLKQVPARRAGFISITNNNVVPRMVLVFQYLLGRGHRAGHGSVQRTPLTAPEIRDIAHSYAMFCCVVCQVDNFLLGEPGSQSTFRRAISYIDAFANSCNTMSIMLCKCLFRFSQQQSTYRNRTENLRTKVLDVGIIGTQTIFQPTGYE